MSGLVLGVDSGGTKTVAILVAPDASIASLRHLPSLDPTGEGDWAAEIAALAATVGDADLQASAFGLPFHGEVDEYSAAQIAAVRLHFPQKPIVENDVRIAFDGAFACGAGALILAGTGSMAWASLGEADSPHIRVGGWGDIFGDEGSAYWLGREVLMLLARHIDGREPSPAFAEGMFAAMGIKPDQLMVWCYGLESRRSGIAGLARHVTALAVKGDKVAGRLLDRAAAELSEQLVVAWRRCGGMAPIRWSYAGGVFNAAGILDRMTVRLGTSPSSPRLPPVGGAALRAARLAGWAVDDAWVDRLGAALRMTLA
ncbi:N-acetylglucosamine kinase [Pleomorphomonas oryzae]|uniref:N-acetylglucosamine kinase n=1 Tax=Pleomorphomonas oryzae TaxID=261934 RepID=UPI0004044567|nr:BadF/BadG/BcrA/BcrD ATPase family protein [Pleomorphomonas oryzae]